MNSDVEAPEIQSAMNDTGEMRVDFRLDPEAYSTLKQLNSSPAWKVYRQMLINAKSEFFNGTLPLDDPYKVMKRIGMVAGMNFAINQLPILVQGFEDHLKKEQARAEAKNKKEVFIRG